MGKCIVLSLGGGGNADYYKSAHHPIPTQENRENPGNFQNKSGTSPFNWLPRYILFLPKLKGRGSIFLWLQEGDRIMRLPPRVLGCHKSWKGVFFCEIWYNPTGPLPLPPPPPLWSLLDLYKCRAWSSMINLSIDFWTYQK